MASILIVVLILIGIGVAVSRRGMLAGNRTVASEPGREAVPQDAGRLMLYLISFAGLMASLFAVMGLISITLAETVFSSRNLVTASDARTQVSYYLAALIVGAPIWLGLWRVIRDRIAQHPAERDAPERRLYFALTFMVTAVVALQGFQSLLDALFSLSSTADTTGTLKDAVQALIRLAVYGTALAVTVRTATGERPLTARDPARDLGLYVVTLGALGFLAIGLWNLVARVTWVLLGSNSSTLITSSRTSWGEIASWIVSGGIAWAALTLLDGRYRGIRPLRDRFLYVVLAAGVVLGLFAVVDCIYEVIRRVFGYVTTQQWDFLQTVLPPLLVGGAIWAFYTAVLFRQAALLGPDAGSAAIPWPRRPYLAVLAALGLGLTTAGAIAVLWLLPQAALVHHDFSSTQWWREELSFGLAALLVGAPLWLLPWRTLDHAATVDPRERATESRRVYLGLIVLAGALAGLGFAIAFLWLLFRMVLGGPHDVATISDMLRYLSTVLVTAAIAAYHGMLLRSDLRATGGVARVQLTALVASDARETARTLSRTLDRDIAVAGYLTGGTPEPLMDLRALEEHVRALVESGESRIFLILVRDGGAAYPYSRGLPREVPLPGPGEEVRIAPSTT